MKLITSGENQIFKAAAQLKQKKYRDEQEKYLIEGPNLIREALSNGGEIEMMIRSEDFNPEEIVNAPMAVMSSGLFRKLSDTENPQGIMAVVKKRIYSEEEFFSPKPVDAYNKKTAASNLIVLDRLQDPGNIGTILRTADAAGYMGAILLKGTADIYSPKIVRAAAGSLFRLPVLMADTPEQVIRILKQHKKKVICTTPNCNRFYYDIDLKENAAVIIGNEGNGVCDEFMSHSDILIKIPMMGSIESLNAAVSAGILMYESVRQRHQGQQGNE
ncbi:MAG TPA: RNA methyltransferase [Anaerovoracaceae bacterium]|nr:RNA methyltransferase [Anaerovoracaceae bacterium]